MKIRLLTVGKVKEKFFRDAIDEYKKRISKFATVEIVEVNDEKTIENASEAMNAQILNKEGERILDKISDTEYVITLEIEGKKLDSIGLSELIASTMNIGKSVITFVIGGSLGLSQKVKNRANYKLSFSDMTFPHQLMRVILLEQIYRSYKIMNGEPYHK